MRERVWRFVSSLFSFLRIRPRSANESELRPDPAWAAEVRASLAFLFEKHGGTLIETTYRPRAFGIQTAVIQVDNLLLRVTRDATLPPHFIEARIAPIHDPNEFRPVQTAYMALQMDQAVPASPEYKKFGTFAGLGESLRETLPKLIQAFSEPNYPTTRDRIDQLDREGWARWKEERGDSRLTAPRLSKTRIL